MVDDVKPEVLKTTQETLGKFVKKPPLTDKLLKKPPFRFLHDIVAGVVRETRFLAGLYTEKEMQSENFTDREAKIAFLQKLIDCVKIVTEKSIAARPSKIVAGLEATKTNELLQTIGYALNKKLDSTAAVSQLLSGQGEPKVKTKSKPRDDKKSTSSKNSINSTPRTRKTVEKKKIEDKAPLTPSKIKESPRTSKISTNKSVKDESGKKKTSKPDKKLVVKEKVSSKGDKKSKSSPRKEKKSSETPKTPKSPKIVETEEISVVEIEEKLQPIITESSAPPEIIETSSDAVIKTKSPVLNHLEIEDKPVEKVTPIKRQKTSVKREPRNTPVHVPAESPIEMLSLTKEAPKVDSIRPKTSLRPPSVRPSSARPGAPRLKDKNDVILPPDELIPMGKVNVIIENYSAAEDQDNEETVVVEAPVDPTLQEPVLMAPKTEIDIPAEKGHLVAQILEQIGDNIPEEEYKKHVEIEWEGGGKRNREAASKEMEKLRSSIQTLTRAANPLGKLMNFLQEDIDSMRSELKLWIVVNEKLVGEIKNEETLIEESVEPLKKQLLRLDEEILKHNEMISSTQANILKNEQKIKALLTRNG